MGIDKFYAGKRELKKRDKMSASSRGETNHPISLTARRFLKAPDAKFSEELKRERSVSPIPPTGRRRRSRRNLGCAAETLYNWGVGIRQYSMLGKGS